MAIFTNAHREAHRSARRPPSLACRSVLIERVRQDYNNVVRVLAGRHSQPAWMGVPWQQPRMLAGARFYRQSQCC